MTDQVDAEAIAAGLSEAQCQALREARRAGFGFRRDTLRAGGRPSARAALERRGLVGHTTSILTAKGRAVRDVLMKEKG